MSTTIDQRVVEMRFDNKNFESNVSTTMSTLDKLKQKLHLDGASKGLENISASAKKVDMSGLGASVETVSSRFSALEVMGVTALANITNSAVNAGKRIISALTIDPVKTGFSEYELKMDSVKTIMASTGESVETVNKYLEELNEYSDQTIYSFADMTQNIGKFTNAGVKLEDAVMAIKGISNEAAVSGANANEASRAMYNFAQALSAGHVKLIDWKSIELANMATKEFKEQLIQSAVSCGTLTKTADGMYKTLDGNVLSATKNFNETLQDQWMTTDVLVSTLKNYANEETEIGKKAFAAAQEVTKLSQMFDVLKETAQSGWARTWELIFGNIIEAKAVFTPLTNFFSSIIDKISDFRNNLLESALASPFQALADKIESVTKVTDKAAEAAKDYADIVDRVINLEFGLGQKRWDRLTEMGYDWAHVQNLVNEKLGDSYRYETNYKESVDEANKSQAVTIEQLASMSEAQLEQIGFTEDEIASFKELAKQSEKTGIPIQDLIKDMDQLSGRSLLINSFKNVGKGLIAVFNSLKSAWEDAFPPKSVEERATALYDFLAALHKFTAQLVPTKEELEDNNSTIGKLTRTFKGLLAIVDIITTVVGGFKAAFTVVKTLLKYFNVDILDATAKIGDLLVRFRDWVEEHNLLAKAIEWMVPYLEKFVKSISDFIKRIKDSGYIQKFANWIKNAAIAVGEWFDKIKNSSKIQGFINSLKKSATAIKDWIAGIKEADNIPKYILSGLVNGIKAGISNVGNAIIEIGKVLIEKIKDVLGIHSPSTVFFAIGGFIMAGLLLGIQNGEGAIFDTIRNFGSKCISVLQEIDFGGIFAIGISAGVVAGVLKISEAFLNFSKMFQGLGQMLEGVGDFLEDLGKGLRKTLSGVGNWLNSKAILNFAIAIAILAASLIALSFIKPAKLWNAVGVIAALAAVMGGLIFVVSLLGKSTDAKGATKISVDLGKFTLVLISIAASMLIMATAMSKIADLKTDELIQAGITIIAFSGIIVGLMAATKLLSGSKNVSTIGSTLLKISIVLLLMAMVTKKLGELDRATLIQGGIAITAFCSIIVGLMAATKLLSGSKNVDNIGSTLLKISIAILLMAYIAKLLGEMDRATLIQGGIAIVAFGAIIVGLMASTKLLTGSSNVDKFGSAMLKMGIAIGIIALCVKMLGGLDLATLAKGTLAIAAFGGIIVGLMAATKLLKGAQNVDKIGSTILKVAVAIGIMALVTMLVSMLDTKALVKGVVAIAAFGAIIVGLMAATKLVGKNDASTIGSTLIKISLAIAILAGVSAILGLIKTENLIKGIVAVGALTSLVSLLMLATKGVGPDGSKTIMMLAIAIGVMALAIGGLSFIDTTKLLGATVAIGILVGMFAILVKASNNVKSSIGTLIVMIAAIVVLAGVLYLITSLPIESSIETSTALGVLMVAMASVMAVLGNIKIKITDALVGLVGLAALGLIMWEFIEILKKMTGMEGVMTNVLAISTLMSVMTVLLLLTAVVGAIYAATGGIAMLGLVGLAAMGLIMWEFVAILKTMTGMEDAMNNVKPLMELMTMMTAILVVVGIVAPLAILGVAAITAMTLLITAIGVLAVGIGALMTEFPQLQTFLDTGIPVLEKLAYAIGSMVGNIIAGFSEAIFSSLPVLGQCLTDFMTNVQGFVDGVRTIDGDVVAGAGILAAAILAIGVADLISCIATLGGIGLIALGTSLSEFMESIQPFVDGASKINSEMLAGVKSLADTILILSAANILDGLSKLFGGESSLAHFGAQLPQLGTDLAAFANNLGTFDESKVTTVTCAASAIKAIADAAKDIPNEGGWLASIVGDNSIGVWGTYLADLGTNIAAFANNLGTFDENKVATVTCAADAIKIIAEAAKEIPNEGGWLASIVGDNSIGVWGTYLADLGTNLATFANNLGTFDEAKVSTVTCAADAIKVIAEAGKNIPNEGGWLAKIVGDNSINTFGGYLPGLGTNLSAFANNLGTFDESKVTTVGCAASAIKSIADVANDIPNDRADWAKRIFGDNSISGFAENFGALGTGIKNFANNLGTFTESKVTTVKQAINALKAIASLAMTDLKAAVANIPSFGSGLASLATDVTTFCNNMPGYDVVKSAIDAAVYAFTTMNNIGGTNSSASTTLSKSLKDLATSGLDAFIDKFTNGSAKRNVKDAGEGLVDSLIDGVEKKEDSFLKTVKSLAEDGADEIEDTYSDYKEAGKYVVQGFAKGITLNDWISTEAAKKMATAAAQAAKDELKINSPSKVFEEIGEGVPEGFSLGIDNGTEMAEDSTTSMGNTIINRIKDGLSGITKFLTGSLENGVENVDTNGIAESLTSSLENGVENVDVNGITESLTGSLENGVENVDTNGIAESIAGIADGLDGDLDIQPTITPVLDLSNVESNAGRIVSILNDGASIGAILSAGSISAMMNDNSQNGVNDDLVSAIDKLRKDIANINNTTYTINGVTYDDGSNISDAVKSIVRAAKVERRR